MATSYRHWLNKDLPPPIPPAELDVLVQELRKGNGNKQKIINGHLLLAMQIVGRYLTVHTRNGERSYASLGKKERADNWVSEAFLAICESVEDAPLKLTDNNITPYIVSRIHSRLARFIAEDRLVHVPYSTFRLHKGTRKPPIPETNEPLVESFDYDLREIFDLACKSSVDHKILDMRKRGYTDQEIGHSIGLSTTKVRQLRVGIESRIKFMLQA